MACIETPTYSPSYDPFTHGTGYFGLPIAFTSASSSECVPRGRDSYRGHDLCHPSPPSSQCRIVLESREGWSTSIDIAVLARYSSFIQDMLVLQLNPPSALRSDDDAALAIPFPICARALEYCAAALEAMSANHPLPPLPEPYAVYLGDILTFADMLDCAGMFDLLLREIDPSAVPARFVVAAVAGNQEAVYDLSPAMLRFESELSAGATWWAAILEAKCPAVYRQLEDLYADRRRAFAYFLERLHCDPTLCREGAVRSRTGSGSGPGSGSGTESEGSESEDSGRVHRQELCDVYLKVLCAGPDYDFRTAMAYRLWEGFAMEPVDTERLFFEGSGYTYPSLLAGGTISGGCNHASPSASCALTAGSFGRLGTSWVKRRPELEKHIARLDIKCDICRRDLMRAVEKILKSWPYVSKSSDRAGNSKVPPSPGQLDWWHIGSKPASRDAW